MIEHLKSGLSISTHVGCTMACSYCVLASLSGFENGPLEDATAEEIVNALLSGRELFLNGETPLIINNRTDPLLPAVIESTQRLLDCLIDSGITSPVLLISKFPPQKWLLSYFEKLSLMFIYSYSNLPTDFNYRLLAEHLKKISDYVPAQSRYHYFRPIIIGHNDDPDKIIDCLSVIQRYHFSGSIVAGLRVTARNRMLINPNIECNPQHKFLENGLFSRILELENKKGLEHFIFRHTSCAIATFQHEQCKLGYYKHKDHCNPACPNIATCTQTVPHNQQSVQEKLAFHLGSDFQVSFISDTVLSVDCQVTQEQLAFIKNAFGLEVKADNIILSPSEKRILGYV